MSKSYLSIDIDFWNDLNAAERSLSRLLLRRGDIPILAVMNHQQLLTHVNRSGANLLINVDEHSDLVDTTVKIFECGSWISYVEWRKDGEYLWVRNKRSASYGSCNQLCNHWNEDSDWGSTKSVFRKQAVDLCPYLQDCVGIGLCLSPSFCVKGAEDLFKMLIKAFYIPYKKGQSNEWNNRRYRRPPDVQAA